MQLLPGMIISNDQEDSPPVSRYHCIVILTADSDPQHIRIMTSRVISSLNVRGTATSIQPPPTALLICPLFLVSSLCIAQWLLCIQLQSRSFYFMC